MFDWHFTPYHRSSERFVTHTGAALHARLRALQPAHGKLTRFRVYPAPPKCPIQTRVRCGSGDKCLNQAMQDNSSGHTPKGTLSGGQAPLQLHGGKRFQGLFHSPRRGTFHRSLTVLCAIGWCVCLALGGGPPSFRPGTSCPAVLRKRQQRALRFPYPAITVCGGGFHTPSGHTTRALAKPAGITQSFLQPRVCNGCRLDTHTVWAVPGSLAATTGMVSVPRAT